MYSRTRFKGCDIALAAIDIVRKERPDLRVMSFGLEEPNAELPLPAGAEFAHRPAQDRIRQIYSSCDAWLFASRSEGFGLPLLESMACRTPVIATPAGPAPDLLGAGGGILVGMDDAGDMARAILRVAAMPEGQWRALSDAAAANAARFTWDRSAALLEQVITNAVPRNGGVVAKSA